MNVPVQLPREEHIATVGDQLVGRSPPMQEVYKAIGRVAPQNVTVLIHGESGTGKELVARAIYQHSDRADGQFLAVNCAAIPEALLESELFGHEKGSFTGADQRRIGKFEQCNGGTIFLDEVGDMSPLMQSKVLRVLQEQQFERVGGTQTIQTDVRIIAATNRDLEKMVADGDFREDLYYRLNGFTIEVPPLRERGDDVLLLLQHCLERFNRELGKDVHGIAPEALDLLLRYSWPGNVRELEAVVRQSLLQTTGSVILPEFLPDFVRDEEATKSFAESSDQPASDLKGWVESRLRNQSHDAYREVIQMTERYLLTMVLRATDGNQSQAAKLLGITRGSLRSKIRAGDQPGRQRHGGRRARFGRRRRRRRSGRGVVGIAGQGRVEPPELCFQLGEAFDRGAQIAGLRKLFHAERRAGSRQGLEIGGQAFQRVRRPLDLKDVAADRGVAQLSDELRRIVKVEVDQLLKQLPIAAQADQRDVEIEHAVVFAGGQRPTGGRCSNRFVGHGTNKSGNKLPARRPGHPH